MVHRSWIAASALLGSVLGIGAALAAWKHTSIEDAQQAAANQPEAAEAVIAAVAQSRAHAESTTSIGTVVALRSVTLRNELPGTVRQVALRPGRIVEAGEVLVALDVSVEEAELRAQSAQADLAQTTLTRIERMHEQRAASREELDRARAERDVALAQVARTRAVIERKTMRAPFRARIGISDVHPGQYLNEGAQLTTLQGVDEAAYVDFAVPQHIAAELDAGRSVELFTRHDVAAKQGKIIAVDSRIDAATRNTMVRARVESKHDALAPGASVRVRVPAGPVRTAIAIPASALRKGPSGDHVFVLTADAQGAVRAHTRAVEVGALLGDEVILDGGLEAGEHIAASGSFKLRDAALVAVVDGPRVDAGATIVGKLQ